MAGEETPPAVETPEAAPIVVAEIPTLLEQHGKETPAEPVKEPETPAPVKEPEKAPEPVEAAKEPAKEPDKAPEPAKEVEAKPPETPAEPAPPPDYTELKLPEHLTANQEIMGNYTGILGEYGVPAEAGQKLLDLHAATLKTAGESMAAHMASEQQRVFSETRQAWQSEAKADPEIGGAGFQTAMGKIARVRDLLIPEADRPALDTFMRVTGAGDHPIFLKMLHRASKYFDEAALPPPDPKPAAQTPTKGMRALYDHPRSPGSGAQ